MTDELDTVDVAPVDDTDFVRLLEHVKTSRGFDFTGYKPASVQRRIRKRMAEVGIDTYADYLDHLVVHPEEYPRLFDTVLINVTRFFRDAETWDAIRREVVPALVDRVGDGQIRVWSAGCATGEEAYSLAMLFAEAMGIPSALQRVKIYATDLDDDALAHARHAAYTDRQVADVPSELLGRYFEDRDGRYTFRGDLRRAVIFGRHDLVQDAPISRVALLTCRNTLMYLNAETQAAVLQRLHFSLRDDGYLVLGKAELLLSHSDLFVPTDTSRRIFTKVADDGLRAQLLTLGRTRGLGTVDHADDRLAVGLAAFESNPVAELVVDLDGLVHLLNRKASQLLGLTPGDLGRPFADLELSYRPVELRSVIDRVVDERRPVTVSDVEWRRGGAGQTAHYDIRLTPVLDGRDVMVGVSISFRDVTETRQLTAQLERMNRELDSAYEELQSTNEELETTNEELQSTVEEQETTNEELQSTNEELETTNEELQSTNAELQGINDELRRRTAELDDLNAFLESVLHSLDAAVTVVDADLRVLVWSEHAMDLWGLRPDEAVGEHLLNLDIGLPVEALRDPVRRCLAAPEDCREQMVLDAVNRRGRAISCKVRISLLRNHDRTVRGVIVLMEEVDGA